MNNKQNKNNNDLLENTDNKCKKRLRISKILGISAIIVIILFVIIAASYFTAFLILSFIRNRIL